MNSSFDDLMNSTVNSDQILNISQNDSTYVTSHGTYKSALCSKAGPKAVVMCINKNRDKLFNEKDKNSLMNFLGILETLLQTTSSLQGVLQASDLNELSIQASHEPILHINSEGIVLKANKSAAEFFDHSIERIVGSTLIELFESSPDLYQKILDTVNSQHSSYFKNQKLKLNDQKSALINLNLLSIDRVYVMIIQLLRS